ncbi:hypothetical protein KPH14_003760 [Odynerus spinipes]|uniref:Uncharacterized protein n=1 Tax=Odynerus spinipes TaxID=1348599 RepID=A0AAD9RX95_9HYME|nr:hypothetical protein KPH14_003760 [Odynerus spinipes]
MAVPKPQEEEATCSPWRGTCQQTSDCCRHLECMTYKAKCVPKTGLIVPGLDTRPLGPPPYAPGLISSVSRSNQDDEQPQITHAAADTVTPASPIVSAVKI